MGATTIRVVVVNYNGGFEILTSLRSVLASDRPNDSLDVVVVDNGSTDGSLERIERELPEVRIVRSPSNLGYAAINQVIADLNGVDYVALLNPDAVVDAGCLSALVDALEGDANLGAACPRILLRGGYRDIQFEIDGHDRNYLDLLEVDGSPNWHLAGPRVRRRWKGAVTWSVGNGATLRVECAEGQSIRLCLQASRPTRLSLRSGDNTARALLGRTPTEVSIVAGGDCRMIVQNAGSIIGKHGLGINRGFHQADGPAFDKAVDVPAWCGAAALLRREYLLDVGGFDPKFFLYYEDLDLSWRGLLRGWRYRYVPEAIVHHAHSTSIGHGTKLYEFHHERNRLLTVTKNAPSVEVIATWAQAVLQLLRRTLVDVVGRLLDRRKPELVRAGRLFDADLSALRLAPAIWRDRKKESSNPLPDQDELPILGRWREPPGGLGN